MSTTAEIREALELAMARIGCPPGDNADADIYHQLSRALALLADMERGGDVVGINYGCAIDHGLLLGAIAKWGAKSQIEMIQEECMELALVLQQSRRKSKDQEALLDKAIDEIADVTIMMQQARLIYDPKAIDERVKFKMDRLERRLNPSPTTADAMNSPVDVQEVVKAGDVLRERLFDITEGNIHAGRVQPNYNADTFAMTVDWTTATKPFRP